MSGTPRPSRLYLAVGAVSLAGNGHAVVMFPEGTRRLGDALRLERRVA
ncbi:MAG TPA: hypothetical protein VFU84_12025 [Gaiellaceae bacterium]|nr:hypothetical protein [Gaiellaceae bacterium]